MTSCEDAPAEAPIQENPQGPILTVAAVSVTNDTPSEINLETLGENGNVNLFTVSTDSLPENLLIFPKVQLSDSEGFDGSVTDLAITYENNIVSASAIDFHMAQLDLFGDDTNPNKVYYRLCADIKNETTGAVYGFGNPGESIASGSATVSPMVSQMVIETNVIKTPGSYNGWNKDASQYLYNVKKDGEYTGRYVGSVLISGEGFKFYTVNDEWIGGDSNNPGTIGGDNIAPTDGNGLYWVDVDFDKNTYSMTKINTVGVIGGMTNWGSDQNLTPNDDFTVWSSAVDVDGEWKIRMNSDWGMNYGGALLNPTFDGSNFSTKGNAVVTINFAGHHPVIKLKYK